MSKKICTLSIALGICRLLWWSALYQAPDWMGFNYQQCPRFVCWGEPVKGTNNLLGSLLMALVLLVLSGGLLVGFLTGLWQASDKICSLLRKLVGVAEVKG